MKRVLLLTALCGLAVSCTTTRPTPSHQPADETEYYVKASPLEELNRRILPDPIGGLGHSNDAQLSVTDIRLTAKYTVLYMTFDHSRGQYGSSSSTQISIDPKAQLVSLDGKETFAFVKAEGIRQTPDHIDVQAGDKAKFVLYFERLKPGIDEFALFECKDSPGLTCWNVTDMHVDNPAAQ
ncbi:hypothetical protein [Fibrella forsythiae]|uniref:Lipoprotein n=1 Tax=Fibrella forsythiae TaxID=2817061 RepID=A0ABS3JEH6_9BACT|nr:hypothetical protein [Fibrella forsythiae]MBO0947848.1 hypothetical protein [Fibrella forsythiae]